jgi:hypothetical protein
LFTLNFDQKFEEIGQIEKQYQIEIDYRLPSHASYFSVTDYREEVTGKNYLVRKRTRKK